MLKDILKNNNNVVVNGSTPLTAIKVGETIKVHSDYTMSDILDADVKKVYTIKGVMGDIVRITINL